MKLKKYIPKFAASWFHFLIALISALIYCFPSRKIRVIAVTGTQGKSTTVNLLGKILEEAGRKTAWVSSLNIKTPQKEEINPFHMTMPGRLFLQKFLRQAVNEKCDFAVIEATSEGIMQHRHQFINFDTALFTNLSFEHIERHGSFENYKKEKGKLFDKIAKGKRKIIQSKKIKKIIIANLDDKNGDYFLNFKADEKWGFALNKENEKGGVKMILAQNSEVSGTGIRFFVEGVKFETSLLGKFNIYNSLAAICAALSQGISLEACQNALKKAKGMEGRMEEIKEGQNFRVFVDLAHTPDSFEKVFEFARTLSPKRIISLFGSAGGGRDKWKRPELGKIAARCSDFIILCNEDPYQENPKEIIESIAKGVEGSGFDMQKCLKIEDRRQAIGRAFGIANEGDIVLLLGKGTEQTMVLPDKTVHWDDREAAREELRKTSNS